MDSGGCFRYSKRATYLSQSAVSFDFANITITLTFKLASALGSVFTSGTALQAAFQNVSELFLAVKQNGEFR
jgi:hypothetical protein